VFEELVRRPCAGIDVSPVVGIQEHSFEAGPVWNQILGAFPENQDVFRDVFVRPEVAADLK